jgi:hypothetical protein
VVNFVDIDATWAQRRMRTFFPKQACLDCCDRNMGTQSTHRLATPTKRTHSMHLGWSELKAQVPNWSRANGIYG